MKIKKLRVHDDMVDELAAQDAALVGQADQEPVVADGPAESVEELLTGYVGEPIHVVDQEDRLWTARLREDDLVEVNCGELSRAIPLEALGMHFRAQDGTRPDRSLFLDRPVEQTLQAPSRQTPQQGRAQLSPGVMSAIASLIQSFGERVKARQGSCPAKTVHASDDEIGVRTQEWRSRKAMEANMAMRTLFNETRDVVSRLESSPEVRFFAKRMAAATASGDAYVGEHLRRSFYDEVSDDVRRDLLTLDANMSTLASTLEETVKRNHLAGKDLERLHREYQTFCDELGNSRIANVRLGVNSGLETSDQLGHKVPRNSLQEVEDRQTLAERAQQLAKHAMELVQNLLARFFGAPSEGTEQHDPRM